jgi:tRNA G18 (ribose-2'-O)-methylase SpoU
MKNRNANVGAVRRTAKEMGAEVLEIRGGHKHNRVRLRTRSGVEFWMHISSGTQHDVLVHRNWTRQAIRRAEARKEVNSSYRQR